jgi:hypothetical protein
MRSFVALLFPSLVVLATSSTVGCSGFSCTSEATLFGITIDREVATNADPSTLSFTSCVDTGVYTECRALPPRKSAEYCGSCVEVSKSSEGVLRVRATIEVSEQPSGTTSIRLEGQSGSVRILTVEGVLEWDSDGCHGTPDRTQL